jgi:hypothetical protein
MVWLLEQGIQDSLRRGVTNSSSYICIRGKLDLLLL